MGTLMAEIEAQMPLWAQLVALAIPTAGGVLAYLSSRKKATITEVEVLRVDVGKLKDEVKECESDRAGLLREKLALMERNVELSSQLSELTLQLSTLTKILSDTPPRKEHK